MARSRSMGPNGVWCKIPQKPMMTGVFIELVSTEQNKQLKRLICSTYTKLFNPFKSFLPIVVLLSSYHNLIISYNNINSQVNASTDPGYLTRGEYSIFLIITYSLKIMWENDDDNINR